MSTFDTTCTCIVSDMLVHCHGPGKVVTLVLSHNPLSVSSFLYRCFSPSRGPGDSLRLPISAISLPDCADITKQMYTVIKESFSFKTRMPGTVKCRPTVAYWVQIDSINIATELITRYYLNGTLIQCCFNVRPTSATLAQHWTNIR